MKNLSRLLLLLCATIAAPGSAEAAPKNTQGAMKKAESKIPTYFPVVKDGAKGRGISEFAAAWYTEYLTVMGEPTLFPAKQETHAYRLLILPTWGNPIAVRAEFSKGLCKLTSSRLSGQGGYEPGKIAERHEVRLSKEDTAAVENSIAALQLFDQPLQDKVLGLDGDQWIFEGASEGRYHVLDIWCAGSDTKKRNLEPFMAMCRCLLAKSKLSQGPMNKDRDLLSTEAE